MASTYTTNNGIEQPGSGEQAGTWGDTTNTNFDLIDRALSGVAAGTNAIDLSGSGSAHTLSTSDGSLSDGLYRVLEFEGATTACTITIDQNDVQKYYIVYNNSGQTLTFTQGSGGDVTVANGDFAIIYADGEGAGAEVTKVVFDTDSIADDAITTAKILDANVTTAKIADDAITNIKMADDSVDTDEIVDDAVTTAKILDGAVTAAKLATGAAFAAGMVMPHAGTTAPTGWLLAYGQAVSRTTYADLFAALGTTYGAGNGSTTFNLPDLRGRVVAGQDDMGGSSANRLTGQSGGVDGDTLGAVGGDEEHTLTKAQMPAHGHDIWSSSGFYTQDTWGMFYTQRQNYVSATNVGSGSYGANNGQGVQIIENTGGGGAHNNVQPTIILNYIIKT